MVQSGPSGYARSLPGRSPTEIRRCVTSIVRRWDDPGPVHDGVGRERVVDPKPVRERHRDRDTESAMRWNRHTR